MGIHFLYCETSVRIWGTHYRTDTVKTVKLFAPITAIHFRWRMEWDLD